MIKEGREEELEKSGEGNVFRWEGVYREEFGYPVMSRADILQCQTFLSKYDIFTVFMHNRYLT